MAEKKQTRSATARKGTRSAPGPGTSNGEVEQHRASEASSTGAANGTVRNSVIEGSNAAVDLDAVRQRAYELYEERGGQHGLHEDDWFRAEQEIRARNRNPQASPQKKSA